MSGTSLDGIDVAVACLSGSGDTLKLEQRAYLGAPYDFSLRTLLLEVASADAFSVSALSQLNVRVAHAFAGVVRRVVEEMGLAVEDLDLVGSHGQTIRHVPALTDCAGLPVRSTLQVGDPSVLASLLQVPTVGDFRLADMALGGQGAPLVPYFDYTFFADDNETRGLLNLGGIANLTILPVGRDRSRVHAFDTGPANIVLDALARHLLGLPYDESGATAASGCVDVSLLEKTMQDPFFEQPPPKSTGRERFGADYVRRFLEWGHSLPPEDILATATELTAVSIFQACGRFARDPLDVLIISGGGSFNRFLIERLTRLFQPVPVKSTDDYGISARAKEALCMAVLAHETMNGVATSMPAVTGAKRPAILGKICLPG